MNHTTFRGSVAIDVHPGARVEITDDGVLLPAEHGPLPKVAVTISEAVVTEIIRLAQTERPDIYGHPAHATQARLALSVAELEAEIARLRELLSPTTGTVTEIGATA